MGKRSNFERVERDFYRTPREAVLPLLPHLPACTWFAEPCAGDGALVDHLVDAGHACAWASDIVPMRDDVAAGDVFEAQIGAAECFITNPPWDRKILHPLIEHLSNQAPTWLLFDADWKHTRQAAPFMDRLRRIVSVGRVKWIPDSKMTGKDNVAWHLFDRPRVAPSLFFGRVLAPATSQAVAA